MAIIRHAYSVFTPVRCSFEIHVKLPLRSHKPLRCRYFTSKNSASVDRDGEETFSAPALRTYNVTKADAKPRLSKHHSISFDEKKVLVPWEEGKTSHFHHIWLRDHCQCVNCKHPVTMQRIADTFSIPRHVKPEEVASVPNGLRIRWKNDGHESLYAWDWLHLHSYSPRLERYISSPLLLWGSEIETNSPEVAFDKVMEKAEGVAIWMAKIVKFGFCYVNNVPRSGEATKSLIEKIAFIRPTHYGGFWNFRSNLEKGDTAYTNLALDVHTDTTYFTDPVGLQLLHLLKHDGSGGETILVDGFRAAKILRDKNPEAYRLLSKIRIPSHASGNPIQSIQPFAPFPVFNHHPIHGELVQIRWNNDDRATMDRWCEGDVEEVEAFYDAIRSWDEVLKERGSEHREKLRPGRPVVFDNWRILHGRTAFDGLREMCGGYIGRDDFMSKYIMTNSSRKNVLKAV